VWNPTGRRCKKGTPRAVVAKPTDLVGDELRFLRKVFGLSVKELAQEWNTHQVTMYKWETGEETITPQIDRLYRLYFMRRGIDKFEWESADLKVDFARIARKPKRPSLCVDVEREKYAYAGRADCP
jgi:transcriptional regulator with XRE-family HTH domain